jgi:hypothetical protein
MGENELAKLASARVTIIKMRDVNRELLVLVKKADIIDTYPFFGSRAT